eukprot:1896568-Pyramimonas_sp.AAC.1
MPLVRSAWGGGAAAGSAKPPLEGPVSRESERVALVIQDVDSDDDAADEADPSEEAEATKMANMAEQEEKAVSVLAPESPPPLSVAERLRLVVQDEEEEESEEEESEGAKAERAAEVAAMMAEAEEKQGELFNAFARAME